ncbi:MAG: GIY-YIG nuclease family protein [Methanolinea sp.]|nr:GIY-YIG nuclease family protein [Methanolinea sp.]
MIKGAYCLVLQNPPCRERVGALGEREFAGGFHVYVGSAGGPGGLARVLRHIRTAGNDAARPRWHIDYLLCSRSFTLVSVHCFPTERRVECRLAALLSGEPVQGFGCSDCQCGSHLFYYPAYPGGQIEKAAAKLSLSVISKTLKNPEGDC